MCFSCGQIVNESQNYILQCECHYCYNCLKMKAEIATKGFHALNRYEKSIYIYANIFI